MKDESLILIAIAGIIILVGGYVIWSTTPYDEPIIITGTITKMWMEAGDDSKTAFDSDGDIIFIPGTSDDYYLVLDRTRKLSIGERTYIGYNVGDEVEITQLSPSSYNIRLINQ